MPPRLSRRFRPYCFNNLVLAMGLALVLGANVTSNDLISKCSDQGIFLFIIKLIRLNGLYTNYFANSMF